MAELTESTSTELEAKVATSTPPSGSGAARAVALLEVLLCSSLPTQILIGGLLGAFNLSPQNADGRLSLDFVFALSLGDSALLITLMVLLSRMHGDSAWALWRGRRGLLRETGLGLLLVPLAVLLAGLLLLSLQRYLPQLHNVKTNPLEALATGGAADAALFATVAVVAGGVREELQRAFLLQRFERHLGGIWVGVVVTSAAFGFGHGMQGWDAAITTGALGAFWAIVYLRRRSSVAPIISHAGFNSLEIVRVATLGT